MPTRGWPDGMRGRRDAFLIVLTETLGHPHQGAREIGPDHITTPGPPADPTLEDGGVVAVAGHEVPTDDDPRRCPACAVVRWLEVLGLADGLGRGSARMALAAAHAPTPASPHQHTPTAPPRWRGAPVLLPAIDRHGWHDDYRPMSPRAIRGRLALAAQRAEHGPGDDGAAVADPEPAVPAAPGLRRPPDLHQVLTLLDDVADDADALSARIQALLEGGVTPGA